MRTLYLLLGIMLVLTEYGKAEPKGNIEREKFIQALLLAGDAFAQNIPVAKQIDLLDQAATKAKQVNLEFLEWVTPGLGNAWKNFTASHVLHASGLRKNEAGDIKEGLEEQLAGGALWEKWEDFWMPRRLAVFKKLQVKL